MNVYYLSLVMLGTCLGCGVGARSLLPNEQVQEVLGQLPEAALSDQASTALFAKGTLPEKDQRPQYALLRFYALETRMEARSGVVKVLIQDSDGHKIGEAYWIFVREGGAWKIKDAPLP